MTQLYTMQHIMKYYTKKHKRKEIPEYRRDTPKERYLYILLCEDACFYVGTTTNLRSRIYRHCRPKGVANWTRKHRPILVWEVHSLGSVTTSEACREEDLFTLDLMRSYGRDKVRGGGYCQEEPKWP